MAEKLKVYTAEPTLIEFHNDKTSFVKYILGPYGSGKSSGCVMDLLMRGMRQQPNSEGVRQTRWAIIRNTYPELKSTTIKTFQEWVPDEIAPVVYGIPVTAKFFQRMEDDTRVEIEFIFMALDSPEDVSKLLSMELTGAYINEGKEIPLEIMEGLLSRIPRFPKTVKDAEGKTLFGPTEPGILIDSNPPRTTHWLYEKFETGKTPRGWRKFAQPPAVYKDTETDEWVPNPDAENLAHLDDAYYQRQIDGSTDDFIRVGLAGEFGMSRLGKPVYAKFSESKHVAKQIILPQRGYPVILGFDFGLQPGCVLLQLTRGIRVLDEIPASDETLEDFLDDYVLPLLQKKYSGFTIVACGDPSGKNRSRIDKRSDFDLLRNRKIRAFPANTNDPVQRIGTVNWFLARDEGFLLSPHLTYLREAMAGGYVFKESRNVKGEVSDTPLKNHYSHICDAKQYACLYARYGTRQLTTNASKTPEKKKFLYA